MHVHVHDLVHDLVHVLARKLSDLFEICLVLGSEIEECEPAPPVLLVEPCSPEQRRYAPTKASCGEPVPSNWPSSVRLRPSSA